MNVARVIPWPRFESAVVTSLQSLRRALNGQWGLMFSHANDFAAYGLEADRWQAHVRVAFDSTEIRPIAFCNEAWEMSSWIVDIGGLAARVSIEDIRAATTMYGLLERKSCRKRETKPRCVALIDAACKLRWSLEYGVGAALPSPIELAAFAEAKRIAQ